MSQSAAPSFALLVRPDGFFKIIDWPAGTGQTLATLRAEIECSTVDVFDATPTLSMWVDDEGLLVESPYENVPAALLLFRYCVPPQRYFGNAVFTGGADENGDTLGLTEGQTLELVGHVLTIHAMAEQSGH
ncbi:MULTISPECIES: DUF3846 domain-containing protein [Streptomyces]|uniref:DUF3846 domain-containing protein n=2 Tax=Streptomyces TaxID=1883 RepID=A0ABU4JYZ5_9ACTN|nr:DUF3846 domain-containing protein [Streptomyces roseolus]MDX2290663.1 DUF3846 domain-containing protein [Streptomyces roseolus]